ncbi:MAG: hypothetical protein HOO90_09135 [Methylotenera sp.]|uniref:hypothetical protein n=1 Tax=Methylotenera sp. TaxID=2051956 RepID=UPI0018228008|nr:hypothetical protein [Methylotenera sp.]NOU25691.1 hypothetical protein [Methylotenera sp.]
MLKKLLFLTLFSFSGYAFAEDKIAEKTNPLEGTWEWVNVKNGCSETYIFAHDGSSHIVSGTEVSDAKYWLSEKPTEKGFYKVTLKIEKDLGGTDCSDDVSDSTGQEYINFLAFHPSGNLYVVCEKETTDSCIGPLKRIQ